MSPPRPFTLPSQLFNPTLYSRLLRLWFADLPPSATSPSQEQMNRWFGASITPEEKAAFDTECSKVSLPALQSIAADQYPLPRFKDAEQDKENYSSIAEPFIGQFAGTKSVAEQDEAALGLVLLLDQMPRNSFRSQQDVIYTHYDRISRAVAYAIYSRGLDMSERYKNCPVWQAWFYLPLMHSEALSDHKFLTEKAEATISRMEQRADEPGLGYAKNLLAFEKRHSDILEQFGRYPHRVKALGGENTDDEKAWLESGGETFGAG